MRQTPAVHSYDSDLVVMDVEFRLGGIGSGDWYVTWISRDRPWELTVMRLPHDERRGRVWHHGRSFVYRISWQAQSESILPSYVGGIMQAPIANPA